MEATKFVKKFREKFEAKISEKTTWEQSAILLWSELIITAVAHEMLMEAWDSADKIVERKKKKFWWQL